MKLRGWVHKFGSIVRIFLVFFYSTPNLFHHCWWWRGDLAWQQLLTVLSSMPRLSSVILFLTNSYWDFHPKIISSIMAVSLSLKMHNFQVKLDPTYEQLCNTGRSHNCSSLVNEIYILICTNIYMSWNTMMAMVMTLMIVHVLSLSTTYKGQNYNYLKTW